MDLKKIDKNWTLFLDRDGVINVEKDMNYILHRGEFVFNPGALEAMRHFAEKFSRIFVVTNQKGVGKGLMTSNDLEDIHSHMMDQIESAGGRIDRIYYCADLDNGSPNRKPNPGMGLLAKDDFPATDFTRSVMVGNTMSDMQFGRNLDMYTIFIPSTKPMPELPHPLVDLVIPSLLALAKAL
jgi:histidinol-phosphate phosphatase family protein